MTEERAELKAAVGMIAEWATNLEGHAGTLDSMIKEPWQNIDGGQCRLNAKRLRLLISALSRDAKPEPGVTEKREALVYEARRLLRRYSTSQSGWRSLTMGFLDYLGEAHEAPPDPDDDEAAYTAALQPPVAGE